MTAIFGTDIETIVYISATLSLIASILVIFCFWFFPHVRTFVTRIIFFLAIAELISAFGRYVQDCTTFAAISQFAGLATFFWMATVGIVQYLTVVKHYRILYKFEILFHIINWGLPLVDAIIIGISGGYGEAGIWCWIENSDTLGRWVGYFLWLFLTMAIVFYCFGSIVFILENRLHSALMPSASLSHHNTKQFQREIVLYLTVIFFVRIWSVMDRLYDLVSDNEAPDLIKDLHALGSCLQGAVNCTLLFFNNRTLRQRLTVGIGEKWRIYQQTKDLKSLTETEAFINNDVNDRESSVQGYNTVEAQGGGAEHSHSMSQSTVFMSASRDYGELYPYWTNDYVIDHSNGKESGDSQLNGSRLKHQAPKSAKLLQSFRIHLATWDSNGSTLYIDDYGKWLPNDGDRRVTTFQQDSDISGDVNKSLPELVAVSTQHLKLAEESWEQRVRQQMGYTQYFKVVTHHLRDHHFVLFVRRDMKHLVGHVQVASTGTTFRQFYGNKGGLAVGINFAGLKIGFVGIDLLNSAETNINTLSKDIQGIAHGLWLERPEIDFNHEFNVLFWMGNLNSGIENGKELLNDIVNASESDKKEDLESGNISGISNVLRDSVHMSRLPNHCHKFYDHDQIYLLRKSNEILHQCHEIDIEFNPTYCLKENEQHMEKYDRSKVPRWCSRIFYATPSHPMIEISPQSYNSVPHLFGSSNHRGVYGEFLINRYNSWFPIPQQHWKFYLKNFQIVLNKSNGNNNRAQQALSGAGAGASSNDQNESGSKEPATVFYEPKVNDYHAMYLTIHAPFLDEAIRTPLGKVKQETSEYVTLTFASRVDFEKLFDEKDVVNMGNFCLYIVVRDENLLGDMDSVAACSVPLLHDEEASKELNKNDKLMRNDDSKQDHENANANDVPLNMVGEKIVYYHFEVPLTEDTSKRGRLEGQIAMRQK